MKKVLMMCAVGLIATMAMACNDGAKQDKKSDGAEQQVIASDTLSYTVGAQSGLMLNFSEMKFLELDADMVRKGMVDMMNEDSVNEEDIKALQEELTKFMMFAQHGIYMRMMNERNGEMGGEEVELPDMYNEQFKREDVSYKFGRNVIMTLVFNNITLNQEAVIKGFNAGMATTDNQDIDKDMEYTEDELNAQIVKLNNILRERAIERREAANKANAEKSAAWLAEVEKMEGVKKSETGLLYRIDRQGNGTFPTEDSDMVLVNYEGKLEEGDIFDSSYERNEPISFRLNGVIPGWTEGLKYIDEGGQITLWIPAELAYGTNPRPGGIIEPNDALEFKVELLKVNPEEPEELEE